MISSKFYSQTVVCPVCFGWGTKDVEPTRSSSVCSECLGQGVSIVQSDTIYVWNAPTFVDYKSRNRVLMSKIITPIIIFGFLLMVLLMIRIVLAGILPK